MKREDVKEIYSISTDKGTLVLVKRNLNYWLCCRGEYSGVPDVLINPKLSISQNGILQIEGIRMSYLKLRNISGPYSNYWESTPVSDLNENWREMIFYSEEDLIKKDVVTWSGRFPFKKRKKEKDVLHLKPGYYLKISSQYIHTEATSNYRITGFKKETISGLIS